MTSSWRTLLLASFFLAALAGNGCSDPSAYDVGGGPASSPASAANPANAPAAPPAAGAAPKSTSPPPPSSIDFSLKQFAGQRPVLIAFGAPATQFVSSLEQLNHPQAADLAIITVLELEQAYPKATLKGVGPLHGKPTMDLVDSFGPPPTGLTVVLISKDGKVVSKEKGSVDPQALLDKLP